MSLIVEEYKDAGVFDYGDSDGMAAEAGSGVVWPVGQGRGGAPAYAPLAWGSCKADDYEHVCGWQVVTDLDGQGGEHVPGRLLAAFWQGKVWLRIDQTGEAPTEGEEDEIPTGAGYVGKAGGSGLPVDAPGRAVLPQMIICPMDARDGCLKTPDGKWRADVFWEPVANYNYHTSQDVFVKDSQGTGWVHSAAMRVTIWAVACGNVLCFYTTASSLLTEEGTEAAAWANRLEYSAWGVTYEGKGFDLQALTKEGGPFAPFWCARLPWEVTGEQPVLLQDEETMQKLPGLLGTHGYLGCMDGIGQSMTPAVVPAPILVCPRLHSADLWGIAYLAVMWPWEYGSGYGEQPTVAEHTGYATWKDAVAGYLLDSADPETNGRYESCADYLFDPVAVEGAGVCAGYNVGYFTPGPEAWPPVAPDYELVCEAELKSPAGKLWLAIAGSTADGVLLTSSCHAEVPPYISGGADDDPTGEKPGGGGNVPSDGPDKPTPVPKPNGENTGGGSGGGSPYYPPTEPDDDPPGEGGEWLADGVYLLSGRYTTVRADRQVQKDAAGEVTNICYTFEIDVRADDELIFTTQGQWMVTVVLSTANSGEYSYLGGTYVMFYNFTASAYESANATLSWLSSYQQQEDSDIKRTSVCCRVPAEVTVVCDFPQSGSASSERLPESNILVFKDTGRTTVKRTGGKKRRFKLYTVELMLGQLGGIAKRKALMGKPVSEVNPVTVVGVHNGPPDAPSVQACHGSSAPNHEDDYSAFPAQVTGCLMPTFGAQYEGTRPGTVSVSGGADWHYGDKSTQAEGSIDGVFDVTIAIQDLMLT